MKKSTQSEVKKIMSDVNFLEYICYLKNRWQDERQYEDWKQYEDCIKKSFKRKKLNVIKITKTFNIQFENKNKDVFLIKFNSNKMNFYHLA